MFYEVRPSLIFLARLLGGLVVDMLLLAPGRPRCPPWRPHRTSKSGRPRAHVVIAPRPGGHFSLGTTCLVAPEQLGLTFPGAEPSGLGPSSLSNVTSLRSEGTPDPSIPPSSVSVGSEAGVRLVKGGPQRPSRRSGGPRERGGYSTETCHPFWFGEVSPHPSSESSENISSATCPPQTVNPSGS